jgi:hypothetical protein
MANAAGPRRTFSLLGRRFSCEFQNVMDACLHTCTIAMEKIVLILGPMLIMFATVIISGLTWTFFTVVLPMLRHYYFENPQVEVTSMSYVTVACHIIYVIFVLTQIVFNYFMCVTTSNKGANYAIVIREMAAVTNFEFPETPQEIETFRRDFEDKMLLRIKRRQMRAAQDEEKAQSKEEEAAAAAAASSSTNGDGSENSGGVTHRKTATTAKKAPVAAKKKKLPTPKQVRNWMIMAPDEWGYCQRSKQPKPPRAHYDHVTKAQVLCLDHYCPWMFNTSKYAAALYYYHHHHHVDATTWKRWC